MKVQIDMVVEELEKPLRENGQEATIAGCSRIVECACSAPFVQYTSCDNCHKLGRMYCPKCRVVGELVETGSAALGYFLVCKHCHAYCRATLEQIELIAKCNSCGREYTDPPGECRYCIPRSVFPHDFPELRNWRWVYEWKKVDQNSDESDPPSPGE